ncbi:AN1-type zinc finger protein [Aspergillus neoniger CBS 115656]|uniref:AN1 zinc finger protein n=1 Tax=Aspergillus neoniger (strain CBS 115656) TaxID=1448310 RepID=A0A318YLD1_ASPNB|nr:AN1 zinc finger protein [Aspergillus neoniger CBS 115656]PYH34954.1 AN1 zinc finger protein [Aspergillus neoniger CBS 115656]
MSPIPSPNQNTSSATDADLDAIGSHCSLPTCNQLDFLPFRCPSCKGTYCLEHRTETAHKCPNARISPSPSTTSTSTSTTQQQQKPNIYTADQCAHISCKTLINTLTDPGVRCDQCRKEYCLRHRLREGHDCRPVSNNYNSRNGARGAGNVGGVGGTDTLKSMFGKLRAWGNKPSSSSSSTSSGSGSSSGRKPPSRAVQLNSMKRTAKGENNIPSDKRIYLHVVGTSETTNKPATDPPRGDFFFDERWKVGRVLDDAARRLQVENVNNRGGGEEEKLRVFHVEGGVFLEFGESVGAKVKSGDTVVLLRGAGVIL